MPRTASRDVRCQPADQQLGMSWTKKPLVGTAVRVVMAVLSLLKTDQQVIV
jgi:hypothetical protein